MLHVYKEKKILTATLMFYVSSLHNRVLVCTVKVAFVSAELPSDVSSCTY